MARLSRNPLIGRKYQAVSEYSFLACAANEYSLIADIRSWNRTVVLWKTANELRVSVLGNRFGVSR